MKKEISVKFNGKVFKVKQHSYRAMFLFEELAGKSVNKANESLKDNILYIYCLLSACNKDFEYSWDDFLDIIEENPNTLNELGLSEVFQSEKK
ncbi:MAG: hypothetical protein FK734_15330 [Asgard group archaeon]|nr:hypothetical protein [Asgard group archaeon]